MNNVIVFGPVQSGKSTLMGYIASSFLSEKLFSIEAYEIEKRIRKLGIADVKKELILPGFLALDRDELLDMNEIQKNSIGTTKRVHRKRIRFATNSTASSKEFTFVDTPGIRDYKGDQYGCMFEGNIGLYVISAIDFQQYWSLQGDNRKKRSAEKRRLFGALQFWCEYKGTEKLIIALTKTDMISSGLENVYDTFLKTVREIVGEGVPVVPTSVLLDDREGVFSRQERNVISLSKTTYWYQGSTLISLLNDKCETRSMVQHKDFRVAAVKQMRKIPNTSSMALRVQSVYGDIDQDDSLILGPVKNAGRESVFLRGAVKSLKIEDGALVDVLPEGVIGGVAFKNLTFYGTRSSNVNLSDFIITPTTALISGQGKVGNIVTMRVKEDEIGGFASQAVQQIKPKEQIRFYWLGKAVIGDLIELYREDGYLYFSLANITDIADHNEKKFFLPESENMLSLGIETLVELHFRKYNFTDAKIESVKTHLLFRVVSISNLALEDKCSILFKPENYYSTVQDLQDNLPRKIKASFDDDNGAIAFEDVTVSSLADYFRAVRVLSSFVGFYSYELKFAIHKTSV